MRFKKYDSKELKHLQNIQLMILKDIIDLCEKNNIDYFAIGGTALGSVRHKGFIPWDDDIDIGMLRSDYDKFLKICKTQLNDNYYVLNDQTEKNFFLPFTKICLKDTIYEEWWIKQVNIEEGIFVDIFVFENTPNNKIRRFIYKWWAIFLNTMVILSTVKYENPNKRNEFIQHIIYYILQILPLSPSKQYFKKYKNSNVKHDYVFYPYVPFFIKKSDIEPLKKLQFEKIKLNVINNVDAMLYDFYGDDYMKLPPEEKRYNHKPDKIDFGKY